MSDNFLQTLIQTPFGWIIIVCCAIFFLPQLLGINPNLVNSLFAKDNSAIADGEWYRLITSVFLHGSFIHLVLNMYSLYVISPQVMDVYQHYGKNGNLSFFTIFFISGVFGSLASYFFTASPSLGASGAIFGLIGALLAYGVIKNDWSIVSGVIQVIAINVIFGLTGGIDNMAHFGGLGGGFLVGSLLLLL